MHACIYVCVYARIGVYACMYTCTLMFLILISVCILSSFQPHNHHLSPNSPRLMFLFVDCATVNKVYLILSYLILSYLSTLLSVPGRSSLLVTSSSACSLQARCSTQDHTGIIAFCITVTSLWARWRLKSPASRLFTQPFIKAQFKENIKAPRHWPLWGEITGDQWIPRTKSSSVDDVIMNFQTAASRSEKFSQTIPFILAEKCILLPRPFAMNLVPCQMIWY